MIEVSVLGPLVVRVDGLAAQVPAGMPHKLLALLLSQPGRPLSSEVLADQLWEGRPPRTARKSIHVNIHRLRRALDMDGRIVRCGSGYLLRIHPSECDALWFQALVSKATKSAEVGDLHAADRNLARALNMWRGPAFDGVDRVVMVSAERHRLSKLRLAALEDRADIELRLGGQHQNLLADLTVAVAMDPFRERMRGQLMLALYRTGRLTEALEEFRLAREIMVSSLGVEPGAALQELHQRMLRQDPSLSM